MGAVLEERRRSTRARIETLIGELKESARLSAGKACVYATGSFARGEASRQSDLDLFIVGKVESGGDHERLGRHAPRGLLRRLDEICLKADLIECTKRLGIPEFSGDGEYLKHYTVHELTKTLGRPEDDATNTFTARLLLLLESRPLVGDAVYESAIEDVVAAYWGDFADHSQHFMPAFLANDILRIWRTFCVNYEARTEREPEVKKAKRKLKNYKLKHSRLLTCYSALLYLLVVHSREGSVNPRHAIDMTRLSPTQRLEWLGTTDGELREPCDRLIEQYEVFLETTDADEHALSQLFQQPDQARRLACEARKFGDGIAAILETVGKRSDGAKGFYRLLIV